MILARIDGVFHGFGAEVVLESVSFELHEGRRVGLVGRNGTGKTTILRLLTGELEPERGSVWVRSGCRVAVVEQIQGFAAGSTVESAARTVFDDLASLSREAEEIRGALGGLEHGSAAERAAVDRLGHVDELFRRRGGYEIDARVRTVLDGLSFRGADREKPVDVLSGGEKNRLALARMLLAAPDVLLLDEPTNHLDLDALEWLEGYLERWQGTFIVVSHDRTFLDAVTRETFVLEYGRLDVYPAPYGQAAEMRRGAFGRQLKAYDLQQKEIRRQEEFIQKNIVGQKTKQAQSRRRMLEKMERLERPVADTSTTRMRLEPTVPGGRDVLMVDDLSCAIGDRVLFEGVSLHLRRGDRVGVLGPNGSGKTTFLKTLVGRRPPHAGSVTLGAGVHVDMLEQELESLNDDHTVLEEVHALNPLAPQGEMRGHLARFLFKGDDVLKPIAALSGGERCRVALSKLFLRGANLLLLDEPTNHLDIDGREALEAGLASYTGTVVAVSHDRSFLNAFARAIFHLHDGRAELHPGSFDEFKARLDAERARGGGATGGEAAGGAAQHAERKATKRERERGRRDVERKRRRLAALEGEIAEKDAALEKLVSAMSAPELAPDALVVLTAQHRAARESRDALYAEWERLAEEVG